MKNNEKVEELTPNKSSQEENFEDELFGQQDSDLSFVTTWDPLNDLEKENSDKMTCADSDLVEICVNESEKSPTNKAKTLRESPLREKMFPLNCDDKSPEFVKNKVVLYLGRYLKWK